MYDGITDIYVVIVPTTMSSLLFDSYSYNGKKNDTTWPSDFFFFKFFFQILGRTNIIQKCLMVIASRCLGQACGGFLWHEQLCLDVTVYCSMVRGW